MFSSHGEKSNSHCLLVSKADSLDYQNCAQDFKDVKLIHFSDVRKLFGGFESPEDGER